MCKMNVTVETWALAADEVGLWLLSGSDAVRSAPLLRANEPHGAVEDICRDLNVTPSVIHSTSWRHEGDVLILTYVVVTEPTDLVRTLWPAALPVTTSLADAVGRPPEHSPVEPPAPRYIDVLLHAIRHLRFLLDFDAVTRQHIPARFAEIIRPLEPALAGLYDPARSAFEYETGGAPLAS